MNMMHRSKIIILAALLAAGAAWTGTAQTNIPTPTNVTLLLNIELTAVTQNATGASMSRDRGITDLQFTRITSRDIIQLLGTALGDTFSRRAKLLVTASSDSPDVWTAIQIQDGTNAPVDVTGFFSHNPGSNTVSGSFMRGRSGQAGTIDYSIDEFNLQDNSGSPALSEHFDVSGLTVVTSIVKVNHHGTTSGQSINISAQVSGTGDVQGNAAVVSGSITASSCGFSGNVSEDQGGNEQGNRNFQRGSDD